MAKRLSQSNTLFNYFQSPSRKQQTPKSKDVEKESVENPMDVQDDSEEEIAPVKKKRARILTMDSDDSDTENIDTQKQPKKIKVDKDTSKSHTTPSGLSTPKLKEFSFGSSSNTEKLELGAFTKSSNKSSEKYTNDEEENEKGKWLHEKLPFLKPDKIRDANGNKPSHPDYDKSSLYVPRDYRDSITPAMRQWWKLKSTRFDTVLFFKVGKFYELYHMDATVGVECLGFSYMKGEFAHSGFPEIGYGRMAASLVEQGYKVARVEQTETPEMMTERCRTIKRPTKFDKVVKREVCQVSEKGVSLHGAQTLDAQQPLGCYMIAICEQETGTIWKRFGVCFIDISIGTFNLAEFEDDKHCSRLLTLTAQHNPALILIERGGMSNDTIMLFTTHLKDVKLQMLSSGKQFPEAASTVETLKRECYFKDSAGNHEWPELFDQMLEEKSFPKPEYINSLRSLGACIWYLKESLIDMHVLAMKKFALYVPIDLQNKVVAQLGRIDHMVLDSVTMENISLLGDSDCLQKTLDYCCTAFGKRMFQMWICRPLCDVTSIKKRQMAVNELFNNQQLLKSAREMLAKLPDIERLIVKIHRFGNAFVAQDHPDARAVLYESKTYSKRKITDLMSALEAFDTVQTLIGLFSNCEARYLRKVTQKAPEGVYIDLAEDLKFFKGAFDHRQAKEEGVIVPKKGVDAEYDAAQESVKGVQEELDDYLEQQRQYFRCDVKYFGSDRKRFQLEVPERYCNKATIKYQLEGSKKGSKPANRYSTAESRNLLDGMMKAEADRAKIVLDLNRRIFEKFGQRCANWEKALFCVTVLDCLCSLSEYARLQSDDICMPTVLPFSDKPICRIENARHPCIDTDKVKLVSNDVHLGGGDRQNLMILTGPNMGGKSTFMRQTVLIAIMAQIGGYVPASDCEISLVDRVFTRMGGQDDIMRGRSTFLVELMEASAILRHANCNSFVLLDELGRGTSTHDGNAIARGYLEELVEINCRGIFATHYHTLVHKFDKDPNIQLGYMTCMLQNEGKENERVVFLYKVARGLWPKSYGFHVALLAGMPLAVVNDGRKYAAAMERKEQSRNLLKNINNLDEVMKLLQMAE